MRRTIVYILGTSYSGSSLLNSLFDSQPLTRGLGEAVHLIQQPNDAWCGHCKCHVDQCRLRQRIDPARFYESVSDVYPEAQVLVNSSKNWELCFDYMPIPSGQYRVCLVVLSKSLEEFAHSFSVHDACGIEESFQTWMRVYQRLLGNIDCVTSHSPQNETQKSLVGRIHEEDVAFVTYRELATETDQTLRRLCDRLALPFNSDYRDCLWRGDTCTIGGNNAIYAQRTGNESFFHPRCEYLNGKYSGRQRLIFYDNHWMDNDELRMAADTWRATRGNGVELLEHRLRQYRVPERTGARVQ